jgi:DNA-directed RNA polymerase specialized sigma24 family protein
VRANADVNRGLPASDGSGFGGQAEARRAVTALYETHALGLIRLGVVMLGDRAAAEDVVQEAFCGLYRGRHGGTGQHPAAAPARG